MIVGQTVQMVLKIAPLLYRKVRQTSAVLEVDRFDRHWPESKASGDLSQYFAGEFCMYKAYGSDRCMWIITGKDDVDPLHKVWTVLTLLQSFWYKILENGFWGYYDSSNSMKLQVCKTFLTTCKRDCRVQFREAGPHLDNFFNSVWCVELCFETCGEKQDLFCL